MHFLVAVYRLEEVPGGAEVGHGIHIVGELYAVFGVCGRIFAAEHIHSAHLKLRFKHIHRFNCALKVRGVSIKLPSLLCGKAVFFIGVRAPVERGGVKYGAQVVRVLTLGKIFAVGEVVYAVRFICAALFVKSQLV